MPSNDFSICPNCGCAVHPAFVDVHRSQCKPTFKSIYGETQEDLNGAITEAVEDWIKKKRATIVLDGETAKIVEKYRTKPRRKKKPLATGEG